MSADQAEQLDEKGPVAIFPLLRWTIPLHALLPVLIAVLADVSDGAAESAMAWVWAFIHLGFPIFLGVTFPWWHGRGEEVVAVLAINHAVTFAVGFALLAWWPT